MDDTLELYGENGPGVSLRFKNGKLHIRTGWGREAILTAEEATEMMAWIADHL